MNKPFSSKLMVTLFSGSRTKSPRTKPPGQNTPGQNPPRTKSPGQNPPGQNPPIISPKLFHCSILSALPAEPKTTVAKDYRSS